MARQTFFSFHYKDVWCVNQIRNLPNIIGSAVAGFKDASLWEKVKEKKEEKIKKAIDKGLEKTTVTVVFIGEKTAGRKYINYEIEKSIERGNGVIGVKIFHLKNSKGKQNKEGSIPKKLEKYKCKIYKYDSPEKLSKWINKAAKSKAKS